MKNISEPEDWQKIPEEDEEDLLYVGSLFWGSHLNPNLLDPLLPANLRLQQEKALRRARRLFFRLQRKKERRLRQRAK